MSENMTFYKHNKRPSFKSQVVKMVMSFNNFKSRIPKAFEENKFSHRPAPLPHSLSEKYDVKISQKNDRKTWTIQYKENPSDKVIFYLHGGAYISNVFPQHWDFIEALLAKQNLTIILPDYPLAPTHTYQETYRFIQEIYEELLGKYDASNILLMGDSAGAGLALGFVQKLRNENQVQPQQIILLAPWLDLTMSNPDITAVVKKDKMLSVEGLKMAGKAYAGDEDLKKYQLSPLYGDFEGLPKISIFIGTHDLFIADSRKLQQLLSEKGIPHAYYEYPKMPHVWMVITSLPEAKDAIHKIAELSSKI